MDKLQNIFITMKSNSGTSLSPITIDNYVRKLARVYYLITGKEYDGGWKIFLEPEKIALNRRGQPRKRKPKEPRVYFTEDTENAIIEYLASTDQDFRNRLYKDRIEYAFYKLSENIIHTFKFYYTDTDTIEELKHEVVTFLLEKLHLYDQSKGKAFSYFGTIAKRYLIVYNNNNYKKLQEHAEIEELDEDKNFMYETLKSQEDQSDPESFIDQYIQYVDKHLYQLFPKQQDARTADAIMELFRKRETLEIFNKKALYIYIREITDTTTPHITKITKKLDTLRTRLFNEWYEHGYIKI